MIAACVVALLALGSARGQEPAAERQAAALPGAVADNRYLGVPPAFDPPPPAEVEARTIALSLQLRCPVCQGLSVNDSPAEGARAMKARVHELVGLGYSDEQILDYWVDRYGTWILLAPPPEGRNWVVYAGPLLVVLFGVAGIATWLVRQGDPPGAAPEPAAAPDEDDELAAYKARILAELGEAGPPPSSGV